MRMMSAVPAHFVFAVIMGYYLGKAKSSKNKQLLFIIMSLFIPVIIHALYDYFMFLDFVPGLWIGGIVTIVISIFIAKKSMIEALESSPFKDKKD